MVDSFISFQSRVLILRLAERRSKLRGKSGRTPYSAQWEIRGVTINTHGAATPVHLHRTNLIQKTVELSLEFNN